MNEELVLHIINTACYGLNLHFSLVPQPPYLYVFFDRSPEAALNYSTLTETIRLAAVSAGLPPEYEYLALYSRIVGEENPDWETAIYLYRSSIPPEASVEEPEEQQEQQDQDNLDLDLDIDDIDSEPPISSGFSEIAETLETSSSLAESSPAESPSEPEALADFESLFGVQGEDGAANLALDQPLSDLRDEFTHDPPIVFEENSDDLADQTDLDLPTDAPDLLPLEQPAPQAIDPDQPLGSSPFDLQSAEPPLNDRDEPIEEVDVDLDLDLDLDFSGDLPLPPPPPPRHLQTAPDRAPATPAKAETDKVATDKAATDKAATDKAATDKAAMDKAATDKAATDKAATDKAATDKAATDKAGEDMSQYYFRAKAKPNAPQAETPTSSPETVPASDESPIPEPAYETVDLSNYCFIRNKLLLSSTIKLPAPEVIALTARLHQFTAAEKVNLASLLDKLYRQPKKSNTEEGAGEALMYQPEDIQLDSLDQPIQEWIQRVLALDPESFRKSAIWFSRYCYNPEKTIAELSIAVS